MLKISTFRCDVSPPIGSPLSGGWIASAQKIVDPLWANGVVLQPDNQSPIVLVAVDWCGLLNGGHDTWRQEIARAVGTTMERVTVHCVHQHDAPWADAEAEEMLASAGDPVRSLDLDFFEIAAKNVAQAAADSLAGSTPVTHIGSGQAEVHQVAASRRIKDENGILFPMRGSSCRDPQLRAAEAGVFDPFLKTVSFWNGEELLAAMHYYATHPMSYYGQGGVSCDFCGLARDEMAAESGAPQLYFNGAGGNIAAGKYNDGSPEMRAVLKNRVLSAMRDSLVSTHRESLKQASWSSLPITFPSRSERGEVDLHELLHNDSAPHDERFRAASELVWRRRLQGGHKLQFSCLKLNDVEVLHLPGEMFVEYQLHAQETRPENFVCTAAYGDCGPVYIPTDVAYIEGGYEPGYWCFVDPSEELIKNTISELLNNNAQ